MILERARDLSLSLVLRYIHSSARLAEHHREQLKRSTWILFLSHSTLCSKNSFIFSIGVDNSTLILTLALSFFFFFFALRLRDAVGMERNGGRRGSLVSNRKF